MSFLEDISRHLPTENKTNLENCLSEWLAECFRRHPLLLDKMVEKIGFAKMGKPEIFTQKRIQIQGKKKQPDIMIYSLKENKRIIIEVKWDAPTHGDQMKWYRKYLDSEKDKEGDKVNLVYLAKYGQKDNDADISISWWDIFQWLEDTCKYQSKPMKGMDFLDVLKDFLKEGDPANEITNWIQDSFDHLESEPYKIISRIAAT